MDSLLLQKPRRDFRSSETAGHVLRAGDSIDTAAFSKMRRRSILEGCKWDSQVGDETTLARFPLIIRGVEWEKISAMAEQLATEAAAAAEEIVMRSELISVLGFPAALYRALSGRAPLSPSAGQVVRFDFHYTTEGWRISEANSDVPGGYTESSHFTAMMASHFPRLRMTGNPVETWAAALAVAAGPGGVFALLSAPGFMEDHQVISFLAGRLREHGCATHLAKPEQIIWRDGAAFLDTACHRGPLDAIVRFYQAEWIARLPRWTNWKYFFRGGKTLVASCGRSVIPESKRFPLTWESLRTPMRTWRALLPETRDPRDVSLSRDDGWLLKPAMCNTGDSVNIRLAMPRREWMKTRLAATLFPGKWVAQRRFESLPVPTPLGPHHACVGIYTVNGKTAGAYARLSEKPVVDFAATDVAFLVDHDD